MSNKEQMSAAELGSKFNNKAEFHFFLTQELDAYLPNSDRLTIYHLRDLMAGDKKVSPIILNILFFHFFDILFHFFPHFFFFSFRLCHAVHNFFI